LSILRYVAEARRYAGIGLLLQCLRSEGFAELTRGELAGELQYLADKGLVVAVEKPVSPEMAVWRITAAGRDYLAQTIE
jgi:DNA-binding PadR family transcriptional regulator